MCDQSAIRNKAAVGHTLDLSLDCAATLRELNVVVACRASHGQIPHIRILKAGLLAQGRPILVVDGYQLAAGIVILIRATFHIHGASRGDGIDAALNAAAADRDEGLALHEADQPAAA